MKWRIQNDFTRIENPSERNISVAIENEEHQIICVVSKDSECFRFNAELIENAPEMYETIQNFVNDVNRGIHKPRRACKEFEKLLERINRFK